MARLQIGKKESFFSVSVLGPVVHSLSPLRDRWCAQFELEVIGVVGPVVVGWKIEANRGTGGDGTGGGIGGGTGGGTGGGKKIGVVGPVVGLELSVGRAKR